MKKRWFAALVALLLLCGVSARAEETVSFDLNGQTYDVFCGEPEIVNGNVEVSIRGIGEEELGVIVWAVAVYGKEEISASGVYDNGDEGTLFRFRQESLPDAIRIYLDETCLATVWTNHGSRIGGEILSEVVEALGEGPWAETLQALEEGEVLERNTRSDTVLGVQETLNGFGQNVTAENRMNSRTIKALNAVQAAFGMEQTESLDADGYAQLLVRLLAYRDDEMASDILRDSMETGNGNEYDYIRGCVFAMKEKYFSAKESFENSRFGDWEKRASECVQKWPKNGQLYRSSSVKGTGMELIISVNAKKDRAMLVKIYTSDGELASMLFIGGTGKVKTKLPGGTYTIKDGSGTEWYGLEEAFGRQGSYETMTFDNRGSTEVTLQNGYSYTISINVSEMSPDATGVGSERENWGSF